MAASDPVDILIAGGGLAGGLIALALAERRPEARLLLVEGDDHLGGNHVWSFFESDMAPAERALVAPLVGHRWDAYDVRFPAHSRTLASPYRSIESEHFDAVLRARLGDRVRLGAKVAAIDPGGITLDGGERIAAKGVIDARGAADLSGLDCGWQKFVGQELVLAAPHGLTRPIVMDATVPQIDGYRFVYVLPFGPDRLFVEDTYYSDDPALDETALTGRIAAYAAAHGWQVTAVTRSESGVLPVVVSGDGAELWDPGSPGVAKAGMRGGLFHPTTGYSLPDAVRTAARIAALPDLSSAALHTTLRDHALTAWKDRAFYRLLDTMLFRAAEPTERYRVLERFYRLAPGLIGRFYAGQSTWADKARILAGKPPVPIGRALGALAGLGPKAGGGKGDR
ncbi:lycopene beta-cyclase CrtY [Sphingomonas naphthae]|uniref:Lycopene beta-cyclase CrtY n=1 Tax=Sphingomonas naphthae TaxID=1813468 RepID=A0ABY7TK09_9SPHN|nr:lycopene beta-cyclase CrtY [Sphingomonas naphthae]WCT73268.1 lycopene beta-cyclase CrtY [Sphingomonas naphthae]